MRRTDAEISQRIETGVAELTQSKLAELVQVAWPAFVKQNIEPTVRQIVTELQTGLPRFIREGTVVVCDECGNHGENALESVHIAELIARGQTKLPCFNPSCKDGNRHHEIRVLLSDWVSSQLNVGKPPSVNISSSMLRDKSCQSEVPRLSGSSPQPSLSNRRSICVPRVGFELQSTGRLGTTFRECLGKH